MAGYILRRRDIIESETRKHIRPTRCRGKRACYVLHPTFFMQKYFNYLKSRGLSQRTVRNYRFYLARFFNFAKIANGSDITVAKITAFTRYLSQIQINHRPLSQLTRNYHLIALRSLLKYLEQQKLPKLPAAKTVVLAKTERRPQTLINADLNKLLAAPLKFNNPKIVKSRDKAILELLFATGLKVSRLSGLTRSCLNRVTGHLKASSKKCQLSHQALYWLKEYLNLRTDNHPALFLSHDRAARRRSKISNLSPRSIQRLVEKYAKSAGLNKKITPETLRRAYANRLLGLGLNVQELQKKLGHRSINATNLMYKKK